MGYYKFTIDSGKALTFWFSKSLQYSTGLYTKYMSFLYKIPNIHRLCCRSNKTQDEQDHLDNCYLEHYLMVYLMGDTTVFLFCFVFLWGFVRNVTCLFVKQDFVLSNRRKLVQTKEQKKEINWPRSKSRKCLDLQTYWMVLRLVPHKTIFRLQN